MLLTFLISSSGLLKKSKKDFFFFWGGGGGGGGGETNIEVGKEVAIFDWKLGQNLAPREG